MCSHLSNNKYRKVAVVVGEGGELTGSTRLQLLNGEFFTRMYRMNDGLM